MIEQKIYKDPPDKKAELRQEKSLPILNEIYQVASGYDPPPRSMLGKAIKYMKKN